MTTYKKMKYKIQDLKSPDLSILRPSVTTSINSILDVIKAYTNGTSEVHNLLSNECDLLYECKVCRNIFRSLTNFISHKRIYCTDKFDSSIHYFFPTKEIDPDISPTKPEDVPSHNKNNTNIINKDLAAIIENLKNRHTKIPNQRNIQLDNVDNTNVAVYQTLKYNEDDNIKTEMNEIYTNELNKKIDIKKLDENGAIIDTINSSGMILCEICKKSFLTRKMLDIHVESNHNDSTTVYKCPSCPKTFLQASTVMKHLSSTHNKSRRNVRLMRENILKKRVTIDELKKKPAIKVETLTKPIEIKQSEADVIDVYKCTHCKKSFNTRTMLNNHTTICLSKFSFKESNTDQPENKILIKRTLINELIPNKKPEVIKPDIKPDIKNNKEIMPEDKIKVCEADCELKPPILKRSLRTRTRKTFKDFILDLPSNITSLPTINSIQPPTIPSRTSKRRNTIQSVNNTADEILIPPVIVAKKIKYESEKIKNSAFLMASKAVELSKASFKVHPKLLAHNIEYEFLARKLPSIRRTSLKTNFTTTNILDYNDLGSTNKIIPDIKKEKSLSNGNSNEIIVKCPTEQEFKQYLIKNRLSEPVKKVFVVAPEI